MAKSKQDPLSPVKQFIHNWNSELDYLIANRKQLNKAEKVVKTEVIDGVKHTWSLSFNLEQLQNGQIFGKNSTSGFQTTTKGGVVRHVATVNLSVISVDQLPQETARELFHELIHLQLAIARQSPTVASESVIYQSFKSVLDSANQAQWEKNAVIKNLDFFRAQWGTPENRNRSAAAEDLFALLVEEKFATVCTERATGQVEDAQAVAFKYAKYEAFNATGDPTFLMIQPLIPGHARNLARNAKEAAVEQLSKSVFSLYEKISPREAPSIPQESPKFPMLELPPLPLNPQSAPAEEKHGFFHRMLDSIFGEGTAHAESAPRPTLPNRTRPGMMSTLLEPPNLHGFSRHDTSAINPWPKSSLGQGGRIGAPNTLFNDSLSQLQKHRRDMEERAARDRKRQDDETMRRRERDAAAAKQRADEQRRRARELEDRLRKERRQQDEDARRARQSIGPIRGMGGPRTPLPTFTRPVRGGPVGTGLGISITEGSGFSVSGSFGSPSYQQKILGRL